jgi:hypothetical protein
VNTARQNKVMTSGKPHTWGKRLLSGERSHAQQNQGANTARRRKSTHLVLDLEAHAIERFIWKKNDSTHPGKLELWWVQNLKRCALIENERKYDEDSGKEGTETTQEQQTTDD